jgi:solute carrier family 34 (sodium-dependent phosphate cotransporter)
MTEYSIQLTECVQDRSEAVSGPAPWLSASPITGLDEATTIGVVLDAEDTRNDAQQGDGEDNVLDQTTTWCGGLCRCILILVVIAPLLFLAASPILYLFTLSLNFISASSKVMTGCMVGKMLGSVNNPVAAVAIGLIATALTFSLGTVLYIAGSLIPTSMSIETGIYIMIGSNIGATMASILASMAHIGNSDELERAFSGAVVNNLYNLVSALVMFPLEWAFHPLKRLAEASTKNIFVDKYYQAVEGFPEKYVVPVIRRVIVSNTKMMILIAENKTYFNCETGGEFYPTECDDPSNPRKSTCSKIGLINCDRDSDECPALFEPGATAEYDRGAGGGIFVVGCLLLFLTAALFAFIMRKIANCTIKINPYLAMIVSCGFTMVTQSSGVITTTLTPMVGVGVLDLDQMYALTIGSNLGTAFTSLIASTFSGSIHTAQLSFAHMYFNLFGVFLFYPIHWARRLVLTPAIQLGKGTRVWRGYPILFICFAFYMVPLFLLGVSVLFEKREPGLSAVASLLVATPVLVLVCWHGRRKYMAANWSQEASQGQDTTSPP